MSYNVDFQYRHSGINLEKFIGCGEDCYQQQPGGQQTQDDLSQDYLLISGGKFVKDEDTNNNNKQTRFSELYCGAGLADDNRGVRVEIPGPPVLR